MVVALVGSSGNGGVCGYGFFVAVMSSGDGDCGCSVGVVGEAMRNGVDLVYDDDDGTDNENGIN